MKGVSVKKIVEKMNLKVLNPEVDIKSRKVTIADVNRPALQLSGDILTTLTKSGWRLLAWWNTPICRN